MISRCSEMARDDFETSDMARDDFGALRDGPR
jgi:hypothetical protein